MNKKIIAAALIATLPTVGHSERWEKGVTLYGWLPGMDGSIGTAYGDYNFSPSGSASSLIDDLDMVFMGTFEAGKGRWRFIKDILYVDLSDKKATPFGVLFSDGKVDLAMWAVSGYLSYQVYESSTFSFDVAGGARYFDIDMTTTLNAGTLPTESVSRDDSWIDPVVALRGEWKFSDKWSATAFADIGGYVGESETWQVLGTVNYNFNEKWIGRFGYRHMDVSQTIDGVDVDIGLSGPVFGLAYRF